MACACKPAHAGGASAEGAVVSAYTALQTKGGARPADAVPLHEARKDTPAMHTCRPVLRDLIRTAEASGAEFHDELLLALRRRAALC